MDFFDIFLKEVSANPHKPAFIMGENQMTFNELDIMSSAIAFALQKQEIKEGDIVPILMPNEPLAFAAMLGIIRIGAAFCFINPEYPKERISFIEKDTSAKLIIDKSWLDNLERNDESFKPKSHEDNSLAYVVYTSGSTGNPKGVLIPYYSMMDAAHFFCIMKGNVGEKDSFLLVASLSFVGGISLSIYNILSSITIHLPNEEKKKDGEYIAHYINEKKITDAFFPPQLAYLLIPKVNKQLKILIVGSDRVINIYDENITIYNLYGASETAGPMTCYKIDKAYTELTPIGGSMNDSKIYILDDDLNKVPKGGVGEICIAGQIALGYLNQPSLTAERFVKNPYSDDPKFSIIYKTNDLGRFREDGVLLFVQRKDWMIKVRGYRVEPGEIEAVMVNHGNVSKAVVTGFENQQGETALYGVYMADTVISPDDVRNNISEYLPDYMIPVFLEQVESLPLNANGKVDRKNIKPPTIERFKVQYEAPSNDSEAEICKAYEKLLGIENIGINDDFILLGGDSMSVVKLQALLPHMGLTSADVFNLRTPRRLASACKEAVTLTKAEKRDKYPLTAAERQMAAESGFDPDSLAYNINFAMKIEGVLDEERLIGALHSLVSRYDILRSYYPFENGEYSHKILDEVSVSLRKETHDINGICEYIKQIDTPYDISKAPLFRFSLYNTGDTQNVLHIGMHHIIIDGTGIAELIDALWELYNKKSLPPVTIDFLDFAVWQNDNISYDKGDEYFTKMFENGIPEYEMPSKALRPSILPAADTVITHAFNSGQIDDAAKAYGITPFALLVSAASLTVSKYLAADDVVIGIAMSGRTLAQTAAMPGMFVNTVPVRVKALPYSTAQEFCKNMADNITEAAKYQDYPFDRLLQAINVERTPSRHPVYDVLINYINEIDFPSVKGLEISEFSLKRQLLPYDFCIEYLRSGDKLNIEISYSKELYDNDVVKNMLEQLVFILQKLIESPKDNLLQIAALPEKQRNQILVDFKGKIDDTNKGKTVLDLFSEQVKANPSKTAVIFKEEKLSYAELDSLSDKLAVYLHKKGIGNNDFVPIMINRSQMMAVCAIGVLKAGAAYQPIDPGYPGERLSFMVSDSGAGIIIADRDLSDKIPLIDGEVLFTDEIEGIPIFDIPDTSMIDNNIINNDSSDVNYLNDDIQSVTITSEDSFILLYTSGTTGNPKGVELSHDNVVSYCTSYIKSHNITEKDTCFAYASFGFDAHIMDFFPAFMLGGTVCIVPEEMRLDIFEMDRYFVENGVTFGFITTQLGRQFAMMERKSKLRFLYTGGEALVPIAPPKDMELINVYGPTETTLVVTEQPIDKLYDRVPIGKVFDNTAIYIIDKYGELAPVGVAGELLIAGRQVSKGYLNRPDLTAEKFIKNRFSLEPEYAVSYRSGDIARFLSNGTIDIVGRNDFQVKIRGYRIELPEIENRIRQHSCVKDASVIALDAPGGGKCAVAYIVADKAIGFEEIKLFILEKLPPQMVPSAVMQIDAIPLNPNGKVDRRKLPAPIYEETDSVDNASQRPMNLLEERLFEITAKLLGHDKFSVTTDLFKVGLASLSAIKLISLIAEEFGTAPKVKDLMAEPTILFLENKLIESMFFQNTLIQSMFNQNKLNEGKLNESMFFQNKLIQNRMFTAIEIDNEIAKETAKEATRESTIVKRSEYPLTKNQLGVYLDCMKDPVSMNYNVPFMLRFAPEIDAKKLRDSLLKVILAHKGINVIIESRGESIVQIPTDMMPEIEIEAVTSADAVKIAENFVKPFNLHGDLLYRFKILKTPENVILLCDIHHIIFDGGSIDILIKDCLAAYKGEKISEERLSALEWSVIESERENSDEWLEDKAYFDEKLKDFDGSSEIASDIQTNQRGKLKEIVEKIDKGKAEAFCKQNGITPAGLFLGVTAYSISRFVGSDNVYIAAISSGRSDFRLFNTLGMFVRTIPIAISRKPDETVMEYIRTTQSTFMDSISHENYPFTEIAKQYKYTPSIMYTCQLGVTNEDYELDNHKFKFEGLGLDTPKFKLSIHVEERDGDIVFAVQYDDSLYSKELMETFTDMLITGLSGIITSPSVKISKISLLSDRQRGIIERFNQTGKANIGVLHKMFEDVAFRNLDKTALIAVDRSYSYKELDEQANMLANGLIQKGVMPGDKVAFMLKRTGKILISMLGIMKTGAAYIPLDPEYPDERIKHVISDSGAVMLIKDSDIEGIMEGQNIYSPDVYVTPDMLAYIIYTSGSTGKPKGVMLEHKGIANYCTAKPENRHVWGLLKYAERMLSITTVAFDMFLKESMTSLCNGLTLVLADEEQAHDPIKLAKLFDESMADAFNTTPSVMLEFTNYPILFEKILSCKVLMCGAEKYPKALLNRLKASKGRLYNTYGPTETSVSCNCQELDFDKPITVGKPLLGVHEQIVDKDGNILPQNVVGELYVAGAGVARGYVNLKEQTAKQFVMLNGERYYRTGDFARWTNDGEIEILGRNDGQIKLRGLRIELGEIEKAMSDIEGMRSCAAVIKKINGAEHICGYYVCDRDITPEEIKESLAKTLTNYMVPTAYLRLPKMPKTPNGKNDLRALPDAVLAGSKDYIAPIGELETKICAVFSKVLGLQRVGATDDFFEIGGTSLAVTRVVFESQNMSIRSADGRDITYSEVFSFPTPRELAKHLSNGETIKEADFGLDTYDYTLINKLLSENTMQNFKQNELRPLGNVLLTGSTGFLGIHILRELLVNVPKETVGKIICLVRRSKKDTPENRLHKWLFYYFNDAFIDDRIIVIEGDMTDEKELPLIEGIADEKEILTEGMTGDNKVSKLMPNDTTVLQCIADDTNMPQSIRIDTVINCAANVSHFSTSDKDFDVNSKGVKRLIDITEAHGARLIQVSTHSIAGLTSEGDAAFNKTLSECMLYFGQNLDNQYIHSKFMAERMILEACVDGLDAKIMRVGNLMAREDDAEFQANALSNNFVGRLRAFEAAGCFPYGAFTSKVELAPIDTTAQAILLLSQTSKECRVFHPYNNHYIFLGDIILYMKKQGVKIDFVEQEEFDKAVNKASKNPKKAEKLVSLIAYQMGDKGRAVKAVESVNEYTNQVLLRFGKTWPETSENYLEKFVTNLMQMGILGSEN